MRRIALLITVLACVGAAAAAPYNLLFYGNSFTLGQGSTRSVPALVKDIAVAAGHESPYVVNASIGGWSLAQHLASNTSAITTAIAPGQRWNYVVLQDFSTQPTHIGSLPTHLGSYAALFQKVRDHSPAALAIGFETWARAPGHDYYAGPNPLFPGGPAQMQQEVRDGYNQSSANVNALHGPGTSRVAPVGDAWENANWQSLHAADLYHAQNRGTLLAALVIYGTIYNDPTVTDIDLTPVLGSLSLSAADGQFLTTIADATLPEPAGALLVVALLPLLRRR